MLTGLNLDQITDPEVASNTGVFLVAIAKGAPSFVNKHLSILNRGLSNPEYRLRSLVLEAFGVLFKPDTEISQLLLDNVHDSNSFTRKKVLKIWSEIVEQPSKLPYQFFPVLARVALGRLEDSGTNVRKAAFSLFENLLTFNPFGPKLTHQLWVEERTRLENLPEEQTTETTQEQLEKARTAVTFIELADASLRNATRLLLSSSTTDVQAAIKLLCTAKQFGSSFADHGLRKSASLIWSSEEGIRKSLVEAYQKLYLPEQDSNRDVMESVIKLSMLPGNASVGELKSLAQIFSQQDIFGNQQVYHVSRVLWSVFQGKIDGLTADENRKAAIVMISMLSKSCTKEQMLLLLKALEDETNAEILYWCVHAIQRFHQDKRIKPNHVLVGRLRHLIIARPTDIHGWLSLAEIAINALYTIAENPDTVAIGLVSELVVRRDQTSPADLIRFVFVSTHVALKQAQHLEIIKAEISRRRQEIIAKKTGRKTLGDESDNDDLEAGPSTSKKPVRRSTKSKAKASTTRGRGKKAAEPVELEGDAELEAASHATEEEKDEGQREKANNELLNCDNPLSRYCKPLVERLCETLLPASSLRHLEARPPLVLPTVLQRVAVIGLMKLMLVDTTICSTWLARIFDIFEVSEDAYLRANIIIGIGDLFMIHASRLANNTTTSASGKTQTWIQRLFTSLKDPQTRVRRNGLMVINRLILKEMIKAREHMHEIAILTQESNDRISGLAKKFFQEQARRSELAPSIPAIVSNLSSASIPYSTFQDVIKFLFSFTTREQLSATLLPAFCERLGNAVSDQEACNYAFCIAHLYYTEKIIKELIQQFKVYSQKLLIRDVWTSFQTALSRANSTAKNDEFKAIIAEWENSMKAAIGEGDGTASSSSDTSVSRIEQSFVGTSQKTSGTRTSNAPGRGSSTARGRGGRGRGRASRVEHSSDESDEGDAARTAPRAAARASTRRSRPTTSEMTEERRASARPRAGEDQSEIDDESFATAIAAPKVKRPSRATKSRVIVDESDESDEGEEYEEPAKPTKAAAARPTRRRRA